MAAAHIHRFHRIPTHLLIKYWPQLKQVWMNLNTLKPCPIFLMSCILFLCSLLPITEGCPSECGIFWEWMCHKQLIQLWPFAGRFSWVRFKSTVHLELVTSYNLSSWMMCGTNTSGLEFPEPYIGSTDSCTKVNTHFLGGLAKTPLQQNS